MTPQNSSVVEQMQAYRSLALEMDRIAQATSIPVARAELLELARQYRELATRITLNLQALAA